MRKSDVKDHTKTPAEIQASEAKYRSLVESIPYGIYIVDSEFKPIMFNKTLEEIFGRSIDYFIEHNPRTYMQCVHPEDLDAIKAAYLPVDGTRMDSVRAEYRIVRPDGEIRHVVDQSQVVRDDAGKPLIYQGLIMDNTDLKRAEAALRESESTLRLITDYMLDVVSMVDVHGIYKFVTSSSKSVWGYEPAEMLGKSSLLFIHPDDADHVVNVISSSMRNRLSGRIEFRFKHADGHYIWIETMGKPVMDEYGKVIGGVYGNRDVTERKLMEERLKYLGLHDSMTGLYNRAYFQEEIIRLDNGRSEPTGVIVCDVDGLKQVNDEMGHASGDELLIAVAQIMKQAFRSSDVVARVGGDEFAVLLPESTEDVVVVACNRLRKAISLHNETALPNISMSIGHAVRTNNSQRIDDLYRIADNNMYREKADKKKAKADLAAK